MPATHVYIRPRRSQFLLDMLLPGSVSAWYLDCWVSIAPYPLQRRTPYCGEPMCPYSCSLFESSIRVLHGFGGLGFRACSCFLKKGIWKSLAKRAKTWTAKPKLEFLTRRHPLPSPLMSKYPTMNHELSQVRHYKPTILHSIIFLLGASDPKAPKPRALNFSRA